ncbi:MAG: hypothetical protein QOG63_2322 [Thermoleophilaceae bacterium]|jgi:uncharacterized membrane protein YgaE (UPF0421/DUF939 family)|nr:hypothetical protein [Thermoleophilaceae bacterium]
MSFTDRMSLRVDALSPERRRAVVEAAWTQSRRSAQSRFGQVRRSLWPVVQTAIAATVAWLIATRALGHAAPFFAPVAAIMALSATRGQRARRAVEMMLGVALGVGLADLLIHAVGSGIIQLAGVVALAMLAALLLGAGQMLLTEAAVSAALVVTLAPSNHSYAPTRLVDALVGGAVALLFSQILFPVNPLKVVRGAAERVLRELGETLSDVASALDGRDLEAAENALVRARRADDDWRQFENALDVGHEAARFAPRRRRLRADVAAYRDVELPIDLIVTDVQVLARSAVRALNIGDAVPDPLVGALRELGSACADIAGRVAKGEGGDETSDVALRAARLATEVREADSSVSANLLIGYTQAMAADVLRALGHDRGSAHDAIGRVAVAAN